jgi:tRNA G10  N-methylase Trm11
MAPAGSALTPLAVERLAFFGSDLITIQRYAGKTNEQFTHLLVNVSVAVSAAAQERSDQGLPVRLLDPLAGRGTSLNRGLMYGFDVTGIDLDGADFEAYCGFLTTYLKDNRLAPKVEEAHIRKGPLAGSRRFTLRIRRTQLVDVIRDDTVKVGEHLGARSFDVLVADLPYGVQHGSTAAGGLTRTPGELVAAALEGWRKVLRAGAGLALAWNTRTFGRDEFEDALRRAGFEVVENADSFDHKGDRSITRGLVIART